MNKQILGLQSIGVQPLQSAKLASTESNKTQGFAQELKKAIEQVDAAQQQSDQATKALINGNIDDLHQVMIQSQKASITLETSVQIQRKVIDAYNEIMRMQV